MIVVMLDYWHLENIRLFLSAFHCWRAFSNGKSSIDILYPFTLIRSSCVSGFSLFLELVRIEFCILKPLSHPEVWIGHQQVRIFILTKLIDQTPQVPGTVPWKL